MAIPEYVKLLTPESQVEWFEINDVGPQPHKVWAEFYVVTTSHKGLHCVSCIEDQNLGYMDFEYCCHFANDYPH